MNPLTRLLSPRARQVLYAVGWTIGIGLSAAQAGFLAAGQQPTALTVAWAVYGVLSAPTHALAGANVNDNGKRLSAPGGNHLAR